MARVAGVDIPNNKRLTYALRYIHGIGPVLAQRVAEKAGITADPRVKDLTEEELNRVRDAIDHGGYVVEGDLRREVSQNIRRLIDVGAYRGLRHRRSLPCRGQRTRTNARTKRGARKTVAGRRRASAKK
jgi:small subunit ribosomal protein S13